jgi:cytosine/adenosine deaminase-related metal-dependent hydrolase
MRVYTATRVFPVISPPVENGAVAVDSGRITAVGPRQAVLEKAGDDAEVRDLGSAAVLPGLVNAHCHVELSWMRDDPPPGGDCVEWVRGLLDRREKRDPDFARQAAESAIEQMLARGTVAVGDVSNESWVVPLLARSSLEGVAFHEIYGPRASDAEALIRKAIERLEELAQDPDVQAAADRWRVVLTPHGPHTTSEPLLRALAGRAAAANHPLTIHLAESDAERTFLHNGSGPFARLFRERGLIDEGWKAPGHTPVAQLDRLGVLTSRSVAVHCVRLDRRDQSKLQARNVHVVTCPRSNERLGVGKAPIPALLGGGIPVALGTDSMASAPDLDLLAEMAALRQAHPQIAPAAVLRMATLNGASALGLADRLGSIGPGKLARLIVVPLAEDEQNPLERICSEPADVHPIDGAPFDEAAA